VLPLTCVPVTGVNCEGPVGEAILESHITLEKLRDVLIRSDLPSMCRNLFSHCCVHWGENKTVRGMGLKVDNIYIVGMGLLL